MVGRILSVDTVNREELQKQLAKRGERIMGPALSANDRSRWCTIRSLVELVAEEAGVAFDKLAEMTPGRVGEDAQYWLDSTRIKTELGYVESIPLREGIRDMVAWGREYLSQLPPPAEFVLRA